MIIFIGVNNYFIKKDNLHIYIFLKKKKEELFRFFSKKKLRSQK